MEPFIALLSITRDPATIFIAVGASVCILSIVGAVAAGARIQTEYGRAIKEFAEFKRKFFPFG